MLCFIDGRILTELDRLTLDPDMPGFDLLEQSLEVVRDLLPEAQVRVIRSNNAASPEEPRWMSLYDEAVADIYESGPVLLVCPSSGVVCRSLVRRLLVRLPKAPGGVVASADPLHHNAHPSWVMRAEGRYDPSERTYEHDSPFHFLMNTLGPDACLPEQSLPGPTEVTGSHRLPELLLATDAVVLAASGQALARARAGGVMDRVASGSCPDIPPIYRQPIFSMAL